MFLHTSRNGMAQQTTRSIMHWKTPIHDHNLATNLADEGRRATEEEKHADQGNPGIMVDAQGNTIS